MDDELVGLEAWGLAEALRPECRDWALLGFLQHRRLYPTAIVFTEF